MEAFMRACFLAVAMLLPALVSAQSFEPHFARDRSRPPAVPTMCDKPAWPKSSLRNEETGVATYNIKVAPNGRVLDVKVARSTGFKDLDKAGLDHLPSCLFRPTVIRGVAVQSFQSIQYVWTLD